MLSENKPQLVTQALLTDCRGSMLTCDVAAAGACADVPVETSAADLGLIDTAG